MEKISFSIEKGEVVGFIGPNGAGKSTTIHLLLNLIFPDSGTARINGHDVVRKGMKVRKNIGYAPSEVNYYPALSVKELLNYSCNFYKKNVSEGKQIDSENNIRKFSDILGLDIERKVGDLSLGNKKKVALVQSLIHDPDILILDEPTNGLDPLVKKSFFDILKAESEKGKTVFFSSHSLSDVQELCERVVFIKEGRIIDKGSASFARRKLMKKVYVKSTYKVNLESLKNNFISDLEKINGSEYKFMYTGEMNELLRILNGMEINDLKIEDASLEEIFMHYYK